MPLTNNYRSHWRQLEPKFTSRSKGAYINDRCALELLLARIVLKVLPAYSGSEYVSDENNKIIWFLFQFFWKFHSDPRGNTFPLNRRCTERRLKLEPKTLHRSQRVPILKSMWPAMRKGTIVIFQIMAKMWKRWRSLNFLFLSPLQNIDFCFIIICDCPRENHA